MCRTDKNWAASYSIVRGNAISINNQSRSTEHFARAQGRREALRATLIALNLHDRPVVWEPGCGHGHFLTAYAAAHPDTICVGVDIAGDRIARANRKRNRANLNRLHFIQADAEDFLAALPAGITLSTVFILFPDPWPKRRHHKNRLLQPGFLNLLAERVGENSRLYFRTDHEPYFIETATIIGAHLKWQPVDEPWPFEVETVFQARAASYRSLVALPRFGS